MIKREKYIAQIREFYDSDLIKIITGIRRCGKSIILGQIHGEIMDKSDNVIYLDFALLLSHHDYGMVARHGALGELYVAVCALSDSVAANLQPSTNW